MVVFKYFKAPTTNLLKEELVYVMKELKEIYKNSFGDGFKLNEFITYYTSDQLVDLLKRIKKRLKTSLTILNQDQKLILLLIIMVLMKSLKQDW